MSPSSPTVVVTGAAGALGRAVAEELLARGSRVVGVDLAGDPLDGVASALGASFLAEPLDPQAPDPWPALLTHAESRFGAPTGAVLCAGGWAGGAAVSAGKDLATVRRMLTLNFETVAAAFAVLVPAMVSRGSGSIVVIGSRAVEHPHESTHAAAYAASKSAVVTYAQVVAAETRSNGLRVNAVLPSTIDTPANRAAMPDADASQWVPAARLARVIAFLLSDDAADVSGAAIPVYGRV
jgi:NAD(P)-dependent dehydrogenase (short-subunit alcohol dehydrogenase family)